MPKRTFRLFHDADKAREHLDKSRIRFIAQECPHTDRSVLCGEWCPGFDIIGPTDPDAVKTSKTEEPQGIPCFEQQKQFVTSIVSALETIADVIE